MKNKSLSQNNQIHSLNILHVVSVSFSIPYFIGNQFNYFTKIDDKFNFFVACSPSRELDLFAKEYNFKPVGVNITRSISPVSDLIAIIRLIIFIRQNKISIVVGHTPKGGLISMISSFLAGSRKRIYFRHGLMFETSKGLKRFVLKNIERITGFFATDVVCVSNEIQAISESLKLSDKNKNIVLGRGTCNGVDCNSLFNPDLQDKQELKLLKQKFEISDDTFVLGFVGRLVRDKGINELISAWEIVQQKCPNSKLLLVGPFEERDKISIISKNKIINDNSIIHTGLIKNTSSFYALMNAFILPSYREGFPTVILEASSMSLPILTTRATGCSEAIIENVTGKFIELDKYSMASSIIDLIDNPIQMQNMGLMGRNFIKQYFDQVIVWNIIEKQLLTM